MMTQCFRLKSMLVMLDQYSNNDLDDQEIVQFNSTLFKAIYPNALIANLLSIY